MPASWADEKLGGLVVEFVDSVSGFVVEGYRAVNGVVYIDVASH